MAKNTESKGLKKMARWLKTSVLILLLCLSANSSFASLSAEQEFDVRTTGSNNNGGCFKAGTSGTDYSQQNSAQYALTSIATAGAGTTFLTVSAAANMIGNCLQVISGTNFVTGLFEVVSVSVGVSVTVDRDITTGVGANGTINIGGSLLTIQKAMDNVVSGNTIWVKDGTYAETVTTPSVDGGSGDPNQLIGYQTTHGDDPTGSNRFDIDGGSVRTNCLEYTNGSGWEYKNFRCHAATGSGISEGIQGNAVTFVNVQSDNNGSHGFVFDGYVSCIGCEANNNTDDGIAREHYNTLIYKSYSHDNGNCGLEDYNSNVNMMTLYSIYDTNSSCGILSGSGFWQVIGNVAYNNTGNGIEPGQGGGNGGFYVFLDNIASTNGGSGFSRLTTTYHLSYHDYNISYNNGTNFNNYTQQSHELTSNPIFTNPAGGDFSVSTTSPAVDASYPVAANLGLSSTLKFNIGVDQTQSGGGACASKIIDFFSKGQDTCYGSIAYK